MEPYKVRSETATDPFDPACSEVLNGDEVLSVREWHRALRQQARRSRRVGHFVVFVPPIVFAAFGQILLYGMRDILAMRLFAELEPRLSGMGGLMDVVAVVGELANTLSHIYFGGLFGAIFLVVGALGVLAGGVSAIIVKVLHLFLPKTRADLCVAKRITRLQVHTVIPSIFTACGVFIGWTFGSIMVPWSRGDWVDPLQELGFIESSAALISGLLFLVGFEVCVTLRRQLRSWEVPREHLLIWLARFLGEMACAVLILVFAWLTFQVIFPHYVAPAMDRLVHGYIEDSIRSVTSANGLEGSQEVVEIVRGAPSLRHFELTPMLVEPGYAVMLNRLLGSFSLAFLALLSPLQFFLAYLTRGVSRGVWCGFSVVSLTFFFFVFLGDGGTWLRESAGVGAVGVYAFVLFALMVTDILARAPGRLARGDDSVLSELRRRSQEVAHRAPGLVFPDADPVAWVYRKVSCPLREEFFR